MAKGRIKSIHKDRGFGFIEAEDGSDIFFHHTGLYDADIMSLQEGQTVDYDVEPGLKGPRAVNVRIKK
jgi:CspA family cold shock protein